MEDCPATLRAICVRGSWVGTADMATAAVIVRTAVVTRSTISADRRGAQPASARHPQAGATAAAPTQSSFPETALRVSGMTRMATVCGPQCRTRPGT